MGLSEKNKINSKSSSDPLLPTFAATADLTLLARFFL